MTAHIVDAERLHHEAVVFEGHSDLMVEVMRYRAAGERNVIARRELPKYRAGGIDVQVLALAGDALNDFSPYNFPVHAWGALEALDALAQEEEEAGGAFAVVRSRADLDRAVAAGTLALIPHFEGGKPLAGQLSMLRNYYRLGLRSLQLIWIGKNDLADSVTVANPGGLSELGIAVVKEMDRLGMVLDLSHLSEPCFYDALELSEYPQLVTHANAKALHDHPRNLSDEQIRRLAAKGGVVGVCFFPRFLQSRTIDGVIDHLDYVVQMVGIDHVGIGPDFIDYMLDLFESPGQLALRAMSDPMPAYPLGIEDMTKLPSFTEGLVRRGYREPDVRKILGENFLRVYRQVLQ